jgi:hypothetical protein
LISGWPNFALSAHRMKSHIIASSQPPPEREARDRGDHRLAAAGDALPLGRDEVGLVDVHVCLGLHVLDVGAGRERLLAAGDHDRADVLVRLEGVDRRGEFAHQRWRTARSAPSDG